MKNSLHFIPAFAILAFAAPARADLIGGAFNTGPSLEKEAAGASLNIAFHSCADEPDLVCATILEAVEPAGPSGRNTLPTGEPVVGFVFIRGLEPEGAGKYRGGKMAAVDESIIKGKMIWYGLKIDESGDGALEATGCLGFICPRKMIWTPVPELDPPGH